LSPPFYFLIRVTTLSSNTQIHQPAAQLSNTWIKHPATEKQLNFEGVNE
jgi:hypothetical protein